MSCQAEDSDGEESRRSTRESLVPRCLTKSIKPSASRSKDLKLPNGSKKKAREPASVAAFKLDGFAILGDGLIQNEERTRLELADDSMPSMAFIQELINQGLAVRSDNEIEIPLSATHEDIVDVLSEHLPGPMAWFEHVGLSVFKDPNSTKIIERAAWCTNDSLAFAVSKPDSDDETGDTPNNGKSRKGKGKKRPTSVEFEQSEEEFPPATQPALKKRKLRARSDADLPSIFTDEIAQEIAFVPARNIITQASHTQVNAVAGPSTRTSNAVSGSSTPLEPVDLTASLSRSPSPWPWARATTPEPSITIDPTYSDPVEYTYSTGPRVLPNRKFF
ncbi:hypothetical protein B0H11DRAFT_1938337 [Mycena galericulata]|nr:hypothetical protein B0H11DRAFT_1938337 [Mycena galericulata]